MEEAECFVLIVVIFFVTLANTKLPYLEPPCVHIYTYICVYLEIYIYI